jgi:hypothetical protein
MATFSIVSTTPFTVSVTLTDDEKTAIQAKSLDMDQTIEDYIQEVLQGPLEIHIQQYRDAFANSLLRRFNAADPATQAAAIAQLNLMLPNA